MMALSPSTFYYEPRVTREEREKQDADLRDRVEFVQTTHPKSDYRTMIITLRLAHSIFYPVLNRFLMFLSNYQALNTLSSFMQEIRLRPSVLSPI